MRVLVAPDKFKGTLTAAQAASAIANGWRRAAPGDEIEQVPMADGGDGTLDSLVESLGGRRQTARVSGPFGDRVVAEFALADREGTSTAIVEMARASGLALVSARRRDVKRATTRGTGELILAACRAGARRVIVCIGGSATNDGGAGMAQALGVRLLDEHGRDLAPGGAALLRLARIDMTRLDRAVAGTQFVVATDVDNPLTGVAGASVVYGPQKGASPEDVAVLDRALGHFAAVIHRDVGVDVRNLPGAGAAGGLGAGLVAFLGAHLRRGVDVVMEAVGLESRVQAADLVVTGEGRFDEQSLHGKVVAGVVDIARSAYVRSLVVCGEATADAVQAFPDVDVFSLVERFGADKALERPGPLLEELASEAAASVAGGRDDARRR